MINHSLIIRNVTYTIWFTF